MTKIFKFYTTHTESRMSCRFQLMNHDVPLFKVLSCTFCYVYMFNSSSDSSFTPLRLGFTATGPVLKADPKSDDKSSYRKGSIFKADLDNSSMVEHICEPLSKNDCKRWTTCCHAAAQCCQRQQSQPVASQNWSHCPRTWDGYGCFDDTSSGNTAYVTCPSYVEHASDQGKYEMNISLNAA